VIVDVIFFFFVFAVATVADPMARQATRATTITRTFFERMSLPRKWTCPPLYAAVVKILTRQDLSL
jgi:hypothetical protein